MKTYNTSLYNTFLENDLLWLNSSLNWDELFFSYFDNYNMYSFLIVNFFVNNFIFIDSVVKLSFLDILFMFENNKVSIKKELFSLFLWDVYFLIDNFFILNNFLFYTNFQDFLSILMFYSPELILVFLDYSSKFFYYNSFNYSIYIFYDVFSDKLFLITSQLLSYFVYFFVYIWLIIFFFNVFRLFKILDINFYFLNLFFFNSFSISKENRLQFEAFLIVVFLFLFYWTMMILTFDSDKEELIESFNSFIFILFNFLIGFLFIKYSIHYFSFLEASIEEGRSVLFISKQFFRDFINTFSLFLRFFVLLFRLNVYDTLDDFYDSYYIFLCDFDDDEYMSELFFSNYSLFFFDSDNFDDANFLMEDETDSIMDVFYLYFLNWAKLFTFIFFITEEFLRLVLAFFICYLIIFDIHAVNASYSEDNYFNYKKAHFGLNPNNNL